METFAFLWSLINLSESILDSDDGQKASLEMLHSQPAL